MENPIYAFSKALYEVKQEHFASGYFKIEELWLNNRHSIKDIFDINKGVIPPVEAIKESGDNFESYSYSFKNFNTFTQSIQPFFSIIFYPKTSLLESEYWVFRTEYFIGKDRILYADYVYFTDNLVTTFKAGLRKVFFFNYEDAPKLNDHESL